MKQRKRAGCKDLWNAFMVEGASFTKNDIPLCPTTAQSIPDKIITYSEAKAIHEVKRKVDPFYFVDSFVCFYEDDQKFDGTTRGVWFRPKGAYAILKHFKGIITPDFSTYQDFPDPIKRMNTYRMRAFGHWYGTICKGQVINNVRWGGEETFDYSFDGIEKHTIVAIGTVGGSPRKKMDRGRFERGLDEMARRLEPKAIIVYGSANYPCFSKLKGQGVKIFSFDGKTALFFKDRRKNNEQGK